MADCLGPLGEALIYVDESATLDDPSLRLRARQAQLKDGVDQWLESVCGHGETTRERRAPIGAAL